MTYTCTFTTQQLDVCACHTLKRTQHTQTHKYTQIHTNTHKHTQTHTHKHAHTHVSTTLASLHTLNRPGTSASMPPPPSRPPPRFGRVVRHGPTGHYQTAATAPGPAPGSIATADLSPTQSNGVLNSFSLPASRSGTTVGSGGAAAGAASSASLLSRMRARQQQVGCGFIHRVPVYLYSCMVWECSGKWGNGSRCCKLGFAAEQDACKAAGRVWLYAQSVCVCTAICSGRCLNQQQWVLCSEKKLSWYPVARSW